jgi:alcohol dehydrogenase
MDTAKGVNIVISENDTDLRKFMGVDRVSKPQKPLIVVPTTAGTGSEVTLVAVISDTKNNIKMPFTSNLLLPKIAVLDPRMTLGLPPRMTAATGMDALTHAVEAYTCLQKNPMSDAYATAAVKMIFENIENAVKTGSDKKVRFSMAVAASLAGIAFSNSMVGAVHAVGHACGAVSHIHHGNAMAILLPYVMKFNSDKIGDLYGELLLHMAGNETFAETPPNNRSRKAIETVLLMNHSLNKISGMPVKLSEAGVKREHLREIAAKALNDGAMLPNPKDLSEKDITAILEEAF